MEMIITMDINLRLPPHIIQVILFSKLPIVNLLVCRLVCKSWNDLVLNEASSTIPHPSFFCTLDHKLRSIDFDRKYLEGMSFVATLPSQPYDELKHFIMTSCNGLLLILKFGRVDKLVTYHVAILNPMTNEYIKLPGADHSYEEDGTLRRPKTYLYYGFGFSPKTKRYKIVRVYRDLKKFTHNFDIFTFGESDDQWRRIYSLPFVIQNQGVYFNGALYWIGIDKRNCGYEYVICRLDVEEETIETIFLSEILPSTQVSIQSFNDGVYATFFYTYPCYNVEVWRMQNYGREDSWIREFVINDVPKDWVAVQAVPSTVAFLKLIKCYEDGEILCIVNNKSSILYNPKYGKIKTFNQLFEQQFTSVYQVDSFHLGSLQKILAGDDG